MTPPPTQPHELLFNQAVEEQIQYVKNFMATHSEEDCRRTGYTKEYIQKLEETKAT